MFSSTRLTSSLILLLVGLLFLATLQIQVSAAPTQALEPVDAAPNTHLLPRQNLPPKGTQPTKPKPPPVPKPNPKSGTRSLGNLIKKLLDDVEAGDPPVIDVPVHVPEDVEYPLRAEGKIKKREKADPPNDPNQDDDCARETCLPSEKCVHMAGREFWAKWVTCCPKGQYADFHGYCCKKSLGKGTGHGNLCPQNPRV